MNLAASAGEPDRRLIFVTFNQDCTSLAVGTKEGYQLYSLGTVDKLERIYSNDTEKDICIVARLFSSSLIAIVSLTAPRKLKVCHFKKGTEICNYSYSNSILAVKLNRQRLVVCLEESIYIHNIRDMKVIHTIRDTPPNSHGLCDLSLDQNHSFLAYPGSSNIGNVQIFDTLQLKAVNSIPAHDSSIASLAFDSTGLKIATASEKGTVIRVFSVLEGTRLFEFRRGMKRCVNISSLAFSSDSLFLSASSNTETVHIFKLEHKEQRQQEEGTSGWTDFMTSAFKSSASYLPSQMTEVFNQFRAFATCRLNVSGKRTICALATVQKIPYVLVVSEDGILQAFTLDPLDGGDCKLVKTHRIDAMDLANDNSSAGDKPLTSKAKQIPDSHGTKHRHAPDSPADSHPYKEVEHGGTEHGIANLKLDDDSEFPPMGQQDDP